MGHILDRGVTKSGGCKVEMERVRERERVAGGRCKRQLPARLSLPGACQCCGQQGRLDSQGP